LSNLKIGLSLPFRRVCERLGCGSIEEALQVRDVLRDVKQGTRQVLTDVAGLSTEPLRPLPLQIQTREPKVSPLGVSDDVRGSPAKPSDVAGSGLVLDYIQHVLRYQSLSQGCDIPPFLTDGAEKIGIYRAHLVKNLPLLELVDLSSHILNARKCRKDAGNQPREIEQVRELRGNPGRGTRKRSESLSPLSRKLAS
jgi:hypothetical protein